MKYSLKILLVTLLASAAVHGFTSHSPFPRRTVVSSTQRYQSSAWDGPGAGSSTGAGGGAGSASTGSIERIEFKIFPDGRVEETVRGVKGGNCHKITDEINDMLGKVVDSAPTEEMYEQELTVSETVELTEGTSGSNTPGWEGSTSW